MVFGLQKLQNDLFCVTEERDYFQTKFLEQVSEISDLNQQLKSAQKEIKRLRQELVLLSSQSQLHLPPPSEDVIISSPVSPRSWNQTGGAVENTEVVIGDSSAAARLKKGDTEDDDDDDDDNSSLTSTSQDGGKQQQVDDDDEEEDIRQNAAQLLQWANYRSDRALSLSSSMRGGERTPSSSSRRESVSSSTRSPDSADGSNCKPRPLLSLLDDEADEDEVKSSKQQVQEEKKEEDAPTPAAPAAALPQVAAH